MISRTRKPSSLICDRYCGRRIQYSHQKKVLTQTIQRFSSEQKESLSGVCRLFGTNRQLYYRAINPLKNKRAVAQKVTALVLEVRMRMPRLGTYQNAAAEQINGILKQEFIREIQIIDIQLMKKLIAQSIDIYNGERPHWSCFMNTPDQMHQHIRIRTYKTKNSITEIHNAI